MIKSCVAAAALLCAATLAVSHGQVFLASRPHPEFLVGPLFAVANVSPGLGPVTVNLSWGLTTRPGHPVADIQQDLYLLWPAEVAESTAPGPAEPQLAREIEARGLVVLGSGRLILRSRDRLQLGTAALGEPVGVFASYVTFTRPGGQTGAVTYIKIPWTSELSDPLSFVTLVLPLRGLVVPKAATWLDELFWGRRHVLTTGFGDLGPPVLGLFSLYYERRDHVVPLARAYSLVIATFGDSDHLKIEEIAPATAVRRQSRVRAGGEVVALTLLPSEDISAQSLRVQFHYFTGRINWRPVVVSVVEQGCEPPDPTAAARPAPLRDGRHRAERDRAVARDARHPDPGRHHLRRGRRAVRATRRGARARDAAGAADPALSRGQRCGATRGGDRAVRRPRPRGHVRHQSLTTRDQGASE